MSAIDIAAGIFGAQILWVLTIMVISAIVYIIGWIWSKFID